MSLINLMGGAEQSPWELGFLTYSGKSFSVASLDTAPHAIRVSLDGMTAYFLGSATATIYQLSLSSAGDISTASYSGKSFSVAAQDAAPYAFDITPDGTQMYIAGPTNDTVYQYGLSTAGDISTSSYTSKNKAVGAWSTLPHAIRVSPDKTKLFLLGAAATDGTWEKIFQFSMSTPGDVTTMAFSQLSDRPEYEDASVRDICFSGEGDKVFTVGLANDRVYQYILSTALSISTMAAAQRWLSVGGQEGGPVGIEFLSDGFQLYMIGDSTNTIYQYSIS